MLSLALASCSSMKGVGEETKVMHERDGIDVVLIPESYVATYFTSEISGERHCRAPEPDVTIQSSEGISLGDGAGDSIGFNDGEAAIALAGRSPSLLLTRELMYRACELTSNLNTDEEATIAIYEKFLEAITQISTTETGNGGVEISTTETGNGVSQ
jgi:hypothetical protein